MIHELICRFSGFTNGSDANDVSDSDNDDDDDEKPNKVPDEEEEDRSESPPKPKRKRGRPPKVAKTEEKPAKDRWVSQRLIELCELSCKFPLIPLRK